MDLLIEKIHAISETEGFIGLLNEIKKELFGNSYIPFSKQQVLYYANNKDNIQRYKEFSIPKKNGSLRTIKAPRKGLKTIQRCVNHLFQQLYEPNLGATGFLPNMSIVSNAEIHLNKRYVYSIDLMDFFPSIKSGRVYSMLQSNPYGFHDNIARIITNLCCDEGCLPQGAPTSPILSNIICSRLDRRLYSLAQKFKIYYSRYADDITFSGNRNIFHKEGSFVLLLEQIIKEEGFVINNNKTRLQKHHQRQKVTGILVNQKINVERTYIKQLRTLIHNWEVLGYRQAQIIFLSHYHPKKHIYCEHYIENIIEGKLNFLKMVKGGGDITYLRLLNRYKKLIESDSLLLTHDKYDKKSSKNSMNYYNTCVSSIAFMNILLEHGAKNSIDSPTKWIVRAKFPLPIEAKNMVKSISIVPSNFGNSVQFTLFDDTYCFIPCDHNLPYGIGDKISCDSIEIIRLSKKDRKDILRIGFTEFCDDSSYRHGKLGERDEKKQETNLNDFEIYNLYTQYKKAYDHGDPTALDKIQQLNQKLKNICLNKNEWSILEIRPFTIEEIAEVESASIVESNFGYSVCFTMKAEGKHHYIPVDMNSVCKVGDVIETGKASLITLGKKGEASILRVYI